MRTALLYLVFAVPLVTFAAQQAPIEPLALVKQTTERMLSALESERETLREHPERLYGLVSEIVLPHFDFSAMARSVLAKHWRRASPGQRERFVEEFRTLLVRTYASSLTEYSGEQVTYLPPRPSSDPDEVIVRTEIQQKSGFPLPVDYRLTRIDGEWKVVDVVIDNLDLVLNYRSSFGREIRRLGLEQVIENLSDRNRQAST